MKLKFIYWNFPFWRAEVSRLALHLGGVEFEDFRPSREQFYELKASGVLPFGQLPVLEVDGEIIAQTGGIARFCGKLGGFYPRNDDVAAARIDQVLDAATDITNLFGPSMWEKDPTKKLELRTKLAEEAIPKWVGFLERLFNQNEGSPYFVGDTMTIADLAIWRLTGWVTGGFLDGIPVDVLDGFTVINSHYQMMENEPRIRAWMDSHYG